MDRMRTPTNRESREEVDPLLVGRQELAKKGRGRLAAGLETDRI